LDEKAADYLRRMRLAAKRMSLLIRDLLAYSRLSSTPTVFEPVSILALVTDIVDDLEIAITKSGVQITVGELPDVPGDSTQLRQLLQNLISNAIKFTHMPAGAAQVAITSRPVNGADMATSANVEADVQKLFWEISVQDNGIGFDPKYLDRIFEVFQRLNSRQQFAGSGIGLAICKRVAENHGGWITAESQPGQGATFRVYLPAEP
ncbi:MAG TPA: ATP-binding protein, partial [Fibrella sp.]